MSIDWPSTRVTIAFLTSLRTPRRPRKRFTLPLRTSGVDRLDLDREQRLDGGLDLGLVASIATSNTTWPCSDAIVDFSVTTGLADHVVVA